MIFISAGHHRNAQGAKFNDVTEYQISTKWVDRIESILTKSCIRVPDGVLREKVEFINIGCAAFDGKHIAAEIHFNSAKIWKDQNANGVIDDGEMVNIGKGSETLYYPASKTGIAAATIMQRELSKVFEPDRGIKEGWYQMNKSKGVDFFLKRTACTSLIIEPEFIDNTEILSEHMDAGCHLIANALLEIERELNNDTREQ